MPTMKKFIAYARAKCAPRLNDEAAAFLAGECRARGGLKAVCISRPAHFS